MNVLLLGGAGTTTPSPVTFDDLKPAEYPANAADSRFLNAFGTKPRAVWASCDEYLTTDAGSSTADQFFATRVKTRIAGGRWVAIAPVFFGGCQVATKSPIGRNAPKVTLAFNLELANGTLTPADYTCPNTGGTIIQGTFGGATDGVLHPGELLIGDFIYASSAGLQYFQWTDRALLPWIRMAWSKANANDQLFVTTATEYNYPCNSHYATCTSYANAKTLINTAGVANYGSGNNAWGAGDSGTLPSCLGFIGIGADGQKSLIFFGTSILDGDGSGPRQQGGVNPANNLPRNYDLLGFPNMYGQDLANQVPVLNLAVGASSMARIWANTGTDQNWVTNTEDVALQRGTICRLVKWFDICTPYDVQNDPVGTLLECIINFCGAVRTANPALKVYALNVPNGYTNEAGVTTAYDAGNIDPKNAHYQTALDKKLIHGILNLRDASVNEFPDVGVQVTSTTTSDGSTTTLNDSAATWFRNQWVGSYVNVGGVKRIITSNTRTQLTFNAFAGTVTNATAYAIEGNTSSDGIHPNSRGQGWLAGLFKTAIAAFESIPYFSRTQ